MHKLIIKENIRIEDLIYEARGIQVMLDSDLARLYECKNGTKEINQAVKNNLNKFPERFSWKLTDEEYKNLRSKFLTSSLNNNYGGRRYNIRVFTEQGVAMLATILKTSVADGISIKIMDAFVSMRKFIANNYGLFERIIEIENDQASTNLKLIEHDDKFNQLFKKLEPPKLENKLFYNGEVYDAYSFLNKIIMSANKEIIIIDNYVDDTTLDILTHKKENVQIKIITTTRSYNRLSINKFKDQYKNISINISNAFHDRFIIIDKQKLYILGTSINNIGSSITTIILINNTKWIQDIAYYQSLN